MRLVRSRTKGAREVGIEEVVIPGSVAVHTVGVEGSIRQIPLTANGTGRVVTIPTNDWLSQLCRVLVEANGTLGGGHFL